MRRLILSVLLTVIGLASLNGVAANSSNESNLSERHREDIFNPAVAAAAFKVGLANVASNARSSNKRANAFGKQLHGGNNVEGSHRTKKNRRTPQVLGDLMGDDAHVVDENGVNVVLLEGGTITSGSVSTVRVVPTTYTTTSGGERSEYQHPFCYILFIYIYFPLFIPRLARICPSSLLSPILHLALCRIASHAPSFPKHTPHSFLLNVFEY